MSDLPKSLRIKSGMISMGERIAWGTDDGKIMVDAEKHRKLQARVKELEAENAELRAELFCNQMCVRYWPSHHVECRLLANRLKRIKLQADDEGEA